MLEKRLFVVWVGLLAELDDFLKQIHALRALIQRLLALDRKVRCFRKNSGVAGSASVYQGSASALPAPLVKNVPTRVTHS